MGKVLKISEERLDELVNQAFLTGAAYGVAEYLKKKGEFPDLDTKELMKLILEGANI